MHAQYLAIGRMSHVYTRSGQESRNQLGGTRYLFAAVCLIHIFLSILGEKIIFQLLNLKLRASLTPPPGLNTGVKSHPNSLDTFSFAALFPPLN
jgi:multisubunit Na+/H+ antiporter MnhG subunit